MSQDTVKVKARHARAWVLAALAATACTLAACGSDSGAGTTGGGGSKLVMLELSFPCKLNEYAALMCDGARAEAAKYPNVRFDIKTGVNYSDNVSYNNLIQTSLQLKPAGLILFPAGPAAQTPIINRACDEGVKIVIVDSPATGLKCQLSFIGANHEQLGAADGRWLADHPPASREVGIVTQPPGEYASTDARVRGFTRAVEAAGFRVVATAITDLSLDKTRTEVQNMVTAHPNLGAVFSANGPMGEGTAQALKGNRRIVQLSLDGFTQDVRAILSGEVAVNTAQNPNQMGRLAVRYLVRALQGQSVPRLTYTTSLVVDRSNAADYIASGGMH